METRTELLHNAVTARQRTDAEHEQRALDTFRQRHGLSESVETVVLYLTWLLGTNNTSGPEIRRRLQHLDTARKLRGQVPLTADHVIQAFLRGLHKEHANTSGGPRCDPLYVELTHALVDATRQPTVDQQRATAAILLAHTTHLPIRRIANFAWNDVRIRSDRLELTVTQRIGRGTPHTRTVTINAKPDPATCLVRALKQLRLASPHQQFLFGDTSGPRTYDRVNTYIHNAAIVRSRNQPQLLAKLAQANQPAPAAVRNRALLLIGYHTALCTNEAINLQQINITRRGRGLSLNIPGRKHITHIPSAPQPQYDPATAWTEWLELAHLHGHDNPRQPAFLQCSFSRIWAKPLSANGLNYLIHQEATRAALTGQYTWSSLRAGRIRGAIRDGTPAHRIAEQVDLTSLGSLDRHEHREHLLSHNVAAMLGL